MVLGVQLLHRSRKQAVEVGVAPLTILQQPRSDSVLIISISLGLANLEVLAQGVGKASTVEHQSHGGPLSLVLLMP